MRVPLGLLSDFVQQLAWRPLAQVVAKGGGKYGLRPGEGSVECTLPAAEYLGADAHHGEALLQNRDRIDLQVEVKFWSQVFHFLDLPPLGRTVHHRHEHEGVHARGPVSPELLDPVRAAAPRCGRLETLGACPIRRARRVL